MMGSKQVFSLLTVSLVLWMTSGAPILAQSVLPPVTAIISDPKPVTAIPKAVKAPNIFLVPDYRKAENPGKTDSLAFVPMRITNNHSLVTALRNDYLKIQPELKAPIEQGDLLVAEAPIALKGILKKDTSAYFYRLENRSSQPYRLGMSGAVTGEQQFETLKKRRWKDFATQEKNLASVGAFGAIVGLILPSAANSFLCESGCKISELDYWPGEILALAFTPITFVLGTGLSVGGIIGAIGYPIAHGAAYPFVLHGEIQSRAQIKAIAFQAADSVLTIEPGQSIQVAVLIDKNKFQTSVAELKLAP